MARSIVALVCCLLFSECTLAAAQERQENGGIATNATLSAPHGQLLRRALLAASQTPLRADAALATRDDNRDREGNWLEKHPILAGALIGFGAGFGLAYAAATDNPESVSSMAPGVRALLYGGATAGVGALIGWGIDRSRNDDDPDFMRSRLIR